MKNKLRNAVLAASVLLAISAGLAPAHAAVAHHKTTHHKAVHTTTAAVDRKMVRTAQMDLSDLGYYSGFYDGMMGTSTKTAIKDFQRHNSIPASGKLNERTYDLIAAAEYKLRHGIGIDIQKHVDNLPPETWHFVSSQHIPLRSGELVVDQEAKSSAYRYTVKLNGQPFLLADNQPGELHVSEVFHLNGEDALIMTAWHGEDTCRYTNYLVTILVNGTVARKHQFDSCARTNEVHEAHNALFVRFEETMNKDGFDRWDVWRYEDTRLVRL